MSQESLWGKIGYLFTPSLGDKDIKEIYTNPGNINLAKLEKVKGDLGNFILRIQEETGIGGKNLLNVSNEERAKFTESAKNDKFWCASLQEILNLFQINASADDVKKHINRSWWNALQLNIEGDSYSKEKGYVLKGPISHSFIAQLSDVGGSLYTGTKKKFQPCSIVGILETEDNKIVLGYRGGANFPDVIMTLPAGSIEPHLERGAVWGSFDKEMLEEIAFGKEHYTFAELVGKATESLLAKGGWHYLVFRTKTPFSTEEVESHWNNAVDKKEHKKLVSYDSDPDKMLKTIRENSWNINLADPELPSRTTKGNYGRILPQCSVSILTNFAQKYGIEWAREAENYLGGHFDLTSCFNK